MQLTSIERLNNSHYGNPRFRLTWIDKSHYTPTPGSAATASDASYNYEIGNPGYRVGDHVEIMLNGRGTIESIDKI